MGVITLGGRRGAIAAVVFLCGASRSEKSRVNSSATVGIEQVGTQRYSMDGNPLTYASFPHT